MTLYDPILQLLKLHRLWHVFGVSGNAINPLVDTLRRDADTRFIHPIPDALLHGWQWKPQPDPFIIRLIP